MSDVGRGTSGIYAIVNTVTGGRYYGSAQCLVQRRGEHWSALQCRTHHNVRLQRAFNKYGESAFAFVVLAVTERTEAWKYEQRLLDKFYGTAGCYNLSGDAFNPMLGRTHKTSTKAKIAHKARGRIMSPESCAKMSASRMGIPRPRTPEHAAALGAALRGRRLSEAHRASMSLVRKGKKKTAEHVAKVAAANRGKKRPAYAIEASVAAHRGKPLSSAHRAKLSAIGQGRKRSPMSIARSAASRVGKQLSTETRARISAAKSGKPLDADHRAALSAAHVGLKRSPESVAKSAASHRGVPRTAEQRAAISAGMTEAGRQKLSEQKRAYWAAKRAALN